MTSTAVATLAQVSNSKAKNTPEFSKAVQKKIALYVAAGLPHSSSDTFYIQTIERFPGLTVQEIVTKIDPNASAKDRSVHAASINKMLRRTAEGRRLVTTGLVSRAPMGTPYWFLNVVQQVGKVDAAAIVPVRSATVQKPRINFPKDVAAGLRNEARNDLTECFDLAGIGRRWHSQATVKLAQQVVRSKVAQVSRENSLAVALAKTTGPMIASMVRDIVAEQVLLTANTPVANQAAA